MNIPELVEWIEGIYQLETTDLVLGGADGIDNLQAKQLANRTQWLKAQIESLGDDKQDVDATLTALAALVTAADKMIYSTGPDAFAMATLTAFARTMLAKANAADFRAGIDVPSNAEMAAAIAALVNSAPGVLDTLNELAAALGNDPNFATTVTTALATKAALAVAQNWTAGQRSGFAAFPALTGTVTLDLAQRNNWEGNSLTGDIVLANPSSMPVGQSGVFRIVNGATPRAIAYGSYFKGTNGVLPSLTSAGGAVDLIGYFVESATRIWIGAQGDSK